MVDLSGERERRMNELGRALTAQGLCVDATITPRTLGLAEWHRVATAPTLPGGDTAVPEPGIVTRDLPHISLVELEPASGVASEARASAGRRADLDLRNLLGEGGMGRVHAAHQRSL